MASDKASFQPLPSGDDPESALATATFVGTTPHVDASRFESRSGTPQGFSDEDLDFRNTANHHMYFCGSCCDFRRAVLVLNGISIALRVLLMVIFAILGVYVSKNSDAVEDALEDDDAKEQFDTMLKSGYLTVLEAVLEVLEMVAIFFAAAGIYGALKFKRWGIVTALSFYGFCLVVTVIMLDVVDALFYGLCLYAHICFLKLMKANIMVDENYHNIASCCGDRKM